MRDAYLQLLERGAISEMEYRALCEIASRDSASLDARNVERGQVIPSKNTGETAKVDTNYFVRKMAERRAAMTVKLDALMAHRSIFTAKDDVASGMTAIDSLVGDVMTNAFASLKAMANAGSSPSELPSKDKVIEAEFTVIDRTDHAGDVDKAGS